MAPLQSMIDIHDEPVRDGRREFKLHLFWAPTNKVGQKATQRRSSSSLEGKEGSTTRKIVSFGGKGRFRKVKHLNDYTEAEIAEMWYTQTEIELIRSMVNMTVKRMEKAEPFTEDDLFCSRGLEGRTKQDYKKRVQHKRSLIREVLIEQEEQRRQGVCDAKTIAEIASARSAASVKAALIAARVNAEDVFHYEGIDSQRR